MLKWLEAIELQCVIVIYILCAFVLERVLVDGSRIFVKLYKLLNDRGIVEFKFGQPPVPYP